MTTHQLTFLVLTLLSFGVFGYTSFRLWQALSLTRKDDWPRLNRIGERISTTLLVAFGQSKMFKRPIAGLFHALVWWGFLVITIGTIEIILDGLFGMHRVLSFLGPAYDVVMASGELFALLVIIACLIFLYRRIVMHIPRFQGKEMTRAAFWDAVFDLVLILLLMFSLLGMNMGYVHSHPESYAGVFPVTNLLTQLQVPALLGEVDMHLFESVNWWIHIGLVYFFLNYLPYSKHFHIIIAVPNVFLSRLEPKAKLLNMASIKREIELLMNPDAGGEEEPPPERFGVKDAEDATWKNLLDAYTCTECGRCTAVCPANQTGKVLSPRKLFVDLRDRMEDKASGLIKEGKDFSDGKALVGDYISKEELWACTTCMACIEECPVNIDHVPFIIDMRRNLVMEETETSRELNEMFQNIETNGAPWPYGQDDRLKWADGVELQTMADLKAKGKEPEILFWVGCAGCFDDRYQKVTRSFAKILNEVGIEWAVLGKEESCTGDPAKRAGHEYIFQMQANQNVELLNSYNIQKIVTACPHCFNTLKNEYPEMGGDYEVVHHSVFLKELIEEGKIQVESDNTFNDQTITFHDACYLGRGNDIYNAPRSIIENLQTEIKEMSNCKEKGLCCGAGGAQMFKEPEPGNKDVNIERTEQALATNPDTIATACPFCMTMMSDGVKNKDKENEVDVLDLAELIAKANNLHEEK